MVVIPSGNDTDLTVLPPHCFAWEKSVMAPDPVIVRCPVFVSRFQFKFKPHEPLVGPTTASVSSESVMTRQHNTIIDTTATAVIFFRKEVGLLFLSLALLMEVESDVVG